MNRTEAMTDAGACAADPAELRKRALAEFEEGYKRYPADAAWALGRQLDRIRATEAADEERKRLSLEAVKDDDAVARLAHAMRAKLTMTRETRGGWWTEGCTNAGLATMLRVCVEKGDPVDVANLCAFLHARGERIPSASRPADVCNEPVRALTKAEWDAEIGRLVPRTAPESPHMHVASDVYGVAAERLTADRPHTKAVPVPRSVPEEGPRNDTADALTYKYLSARPVAVPGADVPASYIVGAIEFAGELNKARRKFGPMASAHEGLAVIAEEFDELKAIVRQKQGERDYAVLRKETVQLGAMVLAFLLEIVNTGNRR